MAKYERVMKEQSEGTIPALMNVFDGSTITEWPYWGIR